MKRSRVQSSHLAVVDGGRAPSSETRATDEELICAIERGDPRVAGQLYDRLFSVVDRTIVRVLGRRESDHDDLVQSAFEQVIATLVTKRFARACSLDAWASTLTSRVAFNALRSRIRERRVVDRGIALEDAACTHRGGRDVEREVGVREELNRMRHHMSEMSEAYATTLFLHDGLGYDLAEVATLTGVSVSAAQSRLVRGRKDLQQRVKSDLPAQESER